MADLNTKAPAFSLLNTKRETVSLDDFKGKKLVIAFYPAAFTGVCKKELCTFQGSLAAYNNLNAAVVGISVDSPFSNGAFAAENGVQFDILSDYNREAVTAYGVTHDDFANMPGYTAAVRSMFVINEDGIISYKWLAPNPGTEPNYDEVAAALS